MSGDENVEVAGSGQDPRIEGFEDVTNWDGDITFHVTTPGGKDLQMLKLTSGGDIYVHGEKVTKDLDVVGAFKEWLRMGLFPADKGAGIAEPGFEIIRRLQERVRVLEEGQAGMRELDKPSSA